MRYATPQRQLGRVPCLRGAGILHDNLSQLVRQVVVQKLALRRKDPDRKRPFRTPFVNIVAPVSILGCFYLFFNLSGYTLGLFVGWAAIGLVVYFAYSRSRSHVGRGIVEVHEDDPDAPPQPVPPIG